MQMSTIKIWHDPDFYRILHLPDWWIGLSGIGEARGMDPERPDIRPGTSWNNTDASSTLIPFIHKTFYSDWLWVKEEWFRVGKGKIHTLVINSIMYNVVLCTKESSTWQFEDWRTQKFWNWCTFTIQIENLGTLRIILIIPLKMKKVSKLNVKSFKSLSLNLSVERIKNYRNLLPNISVEQKANIKRELWAKGMEISCLWMFLLFLSKSLLPIL